MKICSLIHGANHTPSKGRKTLADSLQDKTRNTIVMQGKYNHTSKQAYGIRSNSVHTDQSITMLR